MKFYCVKVGLPHCAVGTVHLTSGGACQLVRVVVEWRNDTTSRGTLNQHHPEADCTTCCTTGLRADHTCIRVDTQINPLSPCAVSGHRIVHLEHKIGLILHSVCKNGRTTSIDLTSIQSGVHTSLWYLLHMTNLTKLTSGGINIQLESCDWQFSENRSWSPYFSRLCPFPPTLR